MHFSRPLGMSFFSVFYITHTYSGISTHTNGEERRGRKWVGARARDAATVAGNATILLQQVL